MCCNEVDLKRCDTLLLTELSSLLTFSHIASLVIETFKKVSRPRPRLLMKVPRLWPKISRPSPRLYAKVSRSRPKPYRQVSRATMNDKKCQVQEFTVIYAQQTHETRVLILKSARKINYEEIKLWLWPVWKIFRLVSVQVLRSWSWKFKAKTFASRPRQRPWQKVSRARPKLLAKVLRPRAWL